MKQRRSNTRVSGRDNSVVFLFPFENVESPTDLVVT